MATKSHYIKKSCYKIPGLKSP